jgi:glutamyl-tRNA synthetase
MYEDLHWFGLRWQEGPDIGGPCAPYSQSQRSYDACFATLRAGGFIYPCSCSRQDILTALTAPHLADEEPIYPGTCRPKPGAASPVLAERKVNWRFRVPDGEVIGFHDRHQGPQAFVAGRDFGDFVVWRHEGVPSYQLAVAADDAAMGITEVVRGADLLLSTARQLLLFKALGWSAPAYYHCPLMMDQAGRRLAKRHDALSLRALCEAGAKPETLRAGWEH